jgi:hypothetical protein
MKKNLGMFFGLPSCGAGAVLMALCAFAPVSRASVIVDNTADTVAGNAYTTSFSQALVFTMPNYSGTISSLMLELAAGTSGTENVEIYSVSFGVPTGSGTLIGTVSSGLTGLISVSLTSSPILSASTSYAIALMQSANGAAWEYTTTSANPGGDPNASVGSLYYYSGAWNVESGQYTEMKLQTTPVPEVPVTGVVMGFGALAIALGRTLRGKLRPQVSSIA